MNRLSTRDAQGNPNGWLLTCWHIDDGPQIDQVYLTVIAPGAVKGPHLHHRRRGLFTLIKGTARIVQRIAGAYVATEMVVGSRLEVAPGIPAALYNTGQDEAFLLNMPSPPWRASEPDEWPVEDWQWPAA